MNDYKVGDKVKVSFIGEIFSIKKGLHQGVVYEVRSEKEDNFNALAFGLTEDNLQEVANE